jgi:hypothetical protein
MAYHISVAKWQFSLGTLYTILQFLTLSVDDGCQWLFKCMHI